MAKSDFDIQRRDFLKRSAALGLGAITASCFSRDAFAASADRVTIYQNTQA